MEHVELDATELRLGLPGTAAASSQPPRGSKRASPADIEDDDCSWKAKVQVVGWPPVRSCSRRNSASQMRKAAAVEAQDKSAAATDHVYVKVSMDGAPYLRKLHLNLYEGYKDLRLALEHMFNCFSIGEYVITYEDKDGDWMMVGDVPFEMFISTCKRLRIMKGSEARGLGYNP